MAEEIVIGKLIIDNSDLDRAMLESKRAVADLEKSQKMLKKETDNLSGANDEQLKTFVDNEMALKKARAEYSANQKSVLELTKAQVGLDLSLSQNIKTQAQAEQNTKSLISARKQIDSTTVEGAKAISNINTKIDANNKFLNASNSELEKQKTNIGNYPNLMDAVSGSFSAATQSVIGFALKGQEVISDFGNNIKAFKETQNASKEATKAFTAAQIIETTATQAATVAETQRVAIGFKFAQGQATATEVETANTAATVANAAATTAKAATTAAATTATTASTLATKALRIAMLAIPLVALLALFTPFIYFLTSTQEGMDKITGVTRPLVAIFQSMLGVLQGLGKSLFETFSNPKQALSDLGEFVKTNLINRFKAFGVILDGIINLDFKKISNGVLQAGTGVENVIGKVANAGKATAKFLGDAAAKGAEINKLTIQNEKAQLAYNQKLEKTNDLIDAEKLKSKDSSKTFKERERAANEIIRLTKDLGKDEEAIVATKIKTLKIQQSLNNTSRKGNQDLITLESELNSAQDRGIDAQLEQMKVIAGARKEAAAAAKEANDKAKAENLKQAQLKIDLLKAESSQQNLSVEQRLANAKKVFEMETSLAKKSFTGIEQQKAILESRQNLSTEILAIAQKQIDKEIENQKTLFTAQKDLDLEAKDKLIQSANDLANAQILLLNKKLLTEKAFADEVLIINQGKNESIAIANASFIEAEKVRTAQKLTEDRAIEALNFEIKMQDIQDRDATEQEIKTLLLQSQYDRELELLNQSLTDKKISEDQFLIARQLAQNKFNSNTAKNDRILLDQKRAGNIKMANEAIGTLQNLFGESKELAIASALMNTFEGITAALKAPTITQRIIGVTFAASTGFAAVKNIMKTDKGSSGGGDSGTQRPTTSTGTGDFSAQTSTVARVSERTQETKIAVTPPVLILETLLEKQNQVEIKIKS